MRIKLNESFKIDEDIRAAAGFQSILTLRRLNHSLGIIKRQPSPLSIHSVYKTSNNILHIKYHRWHLAAPPVPLSFAISRV